MSAPVGQSAMASIDINLLPWREQARERLTRQLYGWMAVCVLIGLGFGALCQQYQQYRLDRINVDVGHIETRIEALEQDISAVRALDGQRLQMQERIELIRQLQFSRPQTVALFQALNDTLVDGVIYDRIVRHEGQLDISGLALANRQVSDQMRALAGTAVFGDPLLLDVRLDQDRTPLRRFNLQVPEYPLTSSQSEGSAMETRP